MKKNENIGVNLKNADSVYLKALLENIPYHIYFKDINSKFTLINQAQADMLGIKNPKDAIGKSDFDFFTPDHARDAYNDEQKIITTGHPVVSKTERVRNADGTFSWMNTTKAAIKDEKGKPIGIVGISYDVTNKIITENQLKKAKEKAEESDNLKSAFLANMSHEIRTPMNGIIGFINLLKEPGINEKEKKEFFDHIETCSHTLLNLVDDIIDISKIESGQLAVLFRETDVNDLLIDIIRTYEELIKKTNQNPVQLQYNLPVSDDKLIIKTDSNRLRQIISNLLNNAFKFTEEGYVELGYELSESHVQFYVKDTGIGIPENKKDIIFERFGQANQSIYLSSKGTGLGLSISKNLAHMLGGDIRFESEEKKGSVFYVKIPLNVSEEIESRKQVPFYSKEYSWKNKTLIMVGPFPDYQTKLKLYLYKTDVNIIWAESIEEAIILYHEHSRIHLILVNWIDGTNSDFSFLNNLQKLNNDIPLIIIISSTSYTEFQSQLKPVCTDFILKPIEKQIFLDKIDKYIL